MSALSSGRRTARLPDAARSGPRSRRPLGTAAGGPRSQRLRLLGALAAVATLGLMGCGGSSKSSSSTTSSSASTASPPSTASTASTATQPTASTPTATAPTTTPAPSGSHTVTATSGAVTASMHAGTHEPRVERAWPLHFKVTSGGKLVKASVSYEYLFAGQVVAHRSHYTFTGRFSDVFRWPSSAVGYPLTFRAVITAQGATLNLDYAVKVAR